MSATTIQGHPAPKSEPDQGAGAALPAVASADTQKTAPPAPRPWRRVRLGTLAVRTEGTRAWQWIRIEEKGRITPGVLSPRGRRYQLRMNSRGVWLKKL